MCSFFSLDLQALSVAHTCKLVIPRNDPQNDSKCINCASESLYIGKSTVILHHAYRLDPSSTVATTLGAS